MESSPNHTNDRALVVTGRGKASADPDVTVLRFDVSAREESYSASVASLDERVESLRSDLEAAGVERKLLKTTGFHVREDSRYDRKKEKNIFLGFVASHGLRLELVVDRELLNRAIGHIAESASEASLGISFDVSDKKSLRCRAMTSAVSDARRSAEVLAEAAGVSLGEIRKIDYSFVEVRHRSGFHYEGAMMLAEATPAPDIEPEEMEAEQSVTVVWGIS